MKKATKQNQNDPIVVGDLVRFVPAQVTKGALTAIKFHVRMHNRVGGKVGLVVQDMGSSVVVNFENDNVVLQKYLLEKIYEDKAG